MRLSKHDSCFIRMKHDEAIQLQKEIGSIPQKHIPVDGILMQIYDELIEQFGRQKLT